MSEPIDAPFFTEIDLLFGKKLGGTASSQFLLALLMAVSRQGHLCLSIDDKGVAPRIEGLTPDHERQAIEGLADLDPALFTGPLVRRGSSLYLKRNDFFERRLEEGLMRLLAADCTPIEEGDFPQLTDEQKSAAQQALQVPFFILSGGPGRGKTFTAAQILRAYLKATPHAKIICAAPTGKATGRLVESLGDIAQSIQSSTLHALLKVKGAADYFKESEVIEGDLILIDESSMIDIRLFALLFDSLRPGTRLILMGDDDQLPPVEAGTVFSQIVAYVRTHYPSSYGHLVTCLRSDRREILDFAQSINEGNRAKALASLEHLDFAPLTSAIPYQLGHHFPDGTLMQPPVEQLLKELTRFAILTPLKKGAFGTEALNQAILRMKCASLSAPRYLAMPILITQNDRRLDLYNGEIALLVRWLKASDDPISERDIAYFPDGRTFPALMLPAYELAYALSVHKSQGSEFDRVALLLPPGSEVFGREVLYTGATRARQKLSLYGERDLIGTLIARTSRRHSTLFAQS